MIFLSMDIETTALDPRNGHILEVGAVLIDTDITGANWPVYSKILLGESIYGEPVALAMNADILEEMSEELKRRENDPLANNYGFVEDGLFVGDFAEWLYSCYKQEDGPITIAGKNFGAFDYRFLERYDFSKHISHHHRFLDIGNLLWVPGIDGSTIPDLRTCMKRYSITGNVEHRALDDAMIVARLIRRLVELTSTNG